MSFFLMSYFCLFLNIMQKETVKTVVFHSNYLVHNNKNGYFATLEYEL